MHPMQHPPHLHWRTAMGDAVWSTTCVDAVWELTWERAESEGETYQAHTQTRCTRHHLLPVRSRSRNGPSERRHCESAERVGVSDKLKATPPGVRETIDRGSPSSEEVRAAKKQLQAIQKANHQVVSRAELRLPRNALQKAAVDSQEAERKRNKRARPLSPQPGS